MRDAEGEKTPFVGAPVVRLPLPDPVAVHRDADTAEKVQLAILQATQLRDSAMSSLNQAMGVSTEDDYMAETWVVEEKKEKKRRRRKVCRPLADRGFCVWADGVRWLDHDESLSLAIAARRVLW